MNSKFDSLFAVIYKNQLGFQIIFFIISEPPLFSSFPPSYRNPTIDDDILTGNVEKDYNHTQLVNNLNERNIFIIEIVQIDYKQAKGW